MTEENNTSQQLCTRTFGTVIYIAWSTRISLVALNIVIAVMTIVSNTLVMVTLHKTKQLRNHSMKLIYVLSLTNVLSGLFAQSCLTILLLMPNQLSCSAVWILVLVIELFIYNSNYLTALLSLDRFLRIRFQHNYHQVYSKSRFKASLCVLYFLISLQAGLGLVARVEGTSSTILTIPVNFLLLVSVVYCYWKSIGILKQHQNKIAGTLRRPVHQNQEEVGKGPNTNVKINDKTETTRNELNGKHLKTNDKIETSKQVQQNEKTDGKCTNPEATPPKNIHTTNNKEDISTEKCTTKSTKTRKSTMMVNSSRLSKLPTLYVIIIIVYGLPLIVAMAMLFVMRQSTVTSSLTPSYWNKWGTFFYFPFVFFFCYNPTNAILFLVFNKYSRVKFKALFCASTRTGGRQRVRTDTLTTLSATSYH